MYLGYSMLAFAVTISLAWSLRPLAHQIGLLDIPGGRKTHVSPTPLIGGLGIFAGIVFTTLWIPDALVTNSPFLSLSALILFIGTIDDAKELTARTRFIGHSLVALVMAMVAGNQLYDLGELVSSSTLQLGILAVPVTVFATVGVINAVNMADGMDGLSAGQVSISVSFIAITACSTGHFSDAGFLSIVLFTLLAFLALNYRRPWKRGALIYLGDAGSTMLGFMLAWLLIQYSQGPDALFSPAYALWFMAIPLMDTVNLLIKRPLAGRSAFKPGRDHLHHLLLAKGLSEGAVVLIIHLVSILLGGTAILALQFGISDAMMFSAFLALFALYFAFVGRNITRLRLTRQ